MLKTSILRNGMALLSMTVLRLALSTGLAEARGVGITHESLAPVQEARSVGCATNAPKDFTEMASQAVDAIVAERTSVQMQASEAASPLNDLRLQLAAQSNVRLSIRWPLTQPAEIK
jgi:hypothetical protein